jgi:acyl-[acyl-carrier-protein]-phospholipid O-acyltransferase / long-chain-fatty-acid--[acyl-carrier-protein] ligase
MLTTRSARHPMRGLLIAQFFGAFNDNAWKLIVALLAIRVVADGGASGTAIELAAQRETMIAFVVFTLPLAFVSVFAGVLSDRLSKRTVIICMKGAEVALMGGATVALWMNPAGGLAALVLLGLMGVQSALFSPAKYGILAEILPHDRLSAGNGLLEMWTFFAIIAGTAAAGVLLDAAGAATWGIALMLTALSAAGLAAAFAVPRVPAARAEGGLAQTLSGAASAIRGDRVLMMAVIGNVVFWTLAGLVGQNILVFAKIVLGLSDSASGLPLAVMAVGIGLGSVAAGRLSGNKVEYGLIPLGTLGVCSMLVLLALAVPTVAGTMMLMALLGLASGLVIVPLNALVQWRSPADRRGAVIALANMFVFTGVLAGSLGAGALAGLGYGAAAIFGAAAAAAAAVTVWVLWLLPDALARLVLVLLTHSFYRLTVTGRGNVPAKGGVLLVPNHVSFVDGLVVMASTDRRVRFLVEAKYFERPAARQLLKLLGAIPISASGGPRVLLRAMREAGRYLDAGEVVCIFPEGQITRTGALLPFRRGFERIIKGRNAVLVPVHLDRLWGSIFSFSSGRFVLKRPERIPYPVTVAFGAPLPPGTPIPKVRAAVQELGEACWRQRMADRRPLHRGFIHAARRHPLRFQFADARRPRLSSIGALAGAVLLARQLTPRWAGQRYVGILLPPSIGGALVNIAALLGGRVSVNLNYTAGKAGLESAARQSGLRTLVTSRAFVQAAKLELPDGVDALWLEDIAAAAGARDRLLALCLAWLAPARWIERACGARAVTSMQDIATVIFSSGSTGEPKGVMLSHFNIDSNVESVAQVFPIRPGDRMLGILPLFHSFGYTATLWLALNHGIGVVFHPNPLDGAAIGELVRRYRVTFLIATPTFLQIYLRRCTPEQFGSLHTVMTGAERLPEKLAQAFEDRFGLRPLEGYGATECAPVIAVSTPGYRAPGFFQSGARRGHVGRPVPGVHAKVVDAESFEELPPGEAGMLLVRGPNVMCGYLGREDLTAQVLRDGWYVTGDIAAMDENGFIQITDRLSRFSKIGGEMVPHGRVEDALHEAAGSELPVLTVTGIPDERKGERLAVLHTLDESALPAILDKLAATGLPNLFIPRLSHFVRVDRIPLLGTGKLDLREIRRIAIERLSATPSQA